MQFLMRKKFFRVLWTCFILGVLAISVTFYCIFTGIIGYMPDLKQLQNPVNKFATQVFSADGKQLGTWSYSSANRVFADFNELPPALVQALIATEDVRFYEHNGIDFMALMRAIVKRGVLQQKSAGGGSTITQQLAKQLYSEKAATTMERALQKPIEWVIALKLERFYTKEEIIVMYFNYFDFLHNAVGIKTAAQTYFGKEPMALDTCQCALLVGMCKNPSYFNPVRRPERCIDRRNTVLMQMEKAGFLTEEQREELRERPLGLAFHRVSHKEGHATYLRDYLRQVLMAKKPNRSDYPAWQQQKYYEDFVNKNPCAHMHYATTKGRNLYSEAHFGQDDYIMFGKESAGIPEEILVQHPDECIRIPMIGDIRSLNLGNSVAIVVYEALRQNGFDGMNLQGELHRLKWQDGE